MKKIQIPKAVIVRRIINTTTAEGPFKKWVEAHGYGVHHYSEDLYRAQSHLLDAPGTWSVELMHKP